MGLIGETAIEVKGLCKRYDDKEAVCGIDLEVAQGEVFGFLGPNGGVGASGLELHWEDIGSLLLWIGLATFIAARRFKWEPLGR